MSIFNPFKSLFKEPIKIKSMWTQYRCENCKALLFEIDQEKYQKESIRIKCRLCKQIEVH